MAEHDTFPPPGSPMSGPPPKKEEPKSDGSYPRGTPCPKCKRPLDSDGWCPDCSRRRKTITVLLLVFLGPILGFGSCILGISSTDLSVLIVVGVALMIVAPIAGIIYAIVAAVQAGKR